MSAERPPHSEQRLRSTLHRTRQSSAPRHRHSHASGAAPASPPPTTSTETDDDLSRAAFLCRTAATASSPIHSPRMYSRPVSPSPSQQSVADESDLSLPRMSSRRKTNSLRGEECCPLSRARLERVLQHGRVIEGRSRSREPSRRDSDSSTGWPWSDSHSVTATKRPKSSTSSESSHCPREYLYHHTSPCPMHARSRSKTDSVLHQHHPGSPRGTATYSPSMLTKSLPSSRAHPSPRRNDSTGSGTTALTPALTADTSPLLNNSRQHQNQQACVDPDDVRLLTPPPTPPLHASPYMRPYKRREIDVGSVERLDLTLATAGPATTTTNTFNARKASETCRKMEGYISFAAVEGLGMPPNGVDDDENDCCNDDATADDLKRGSNRIGTWARKLFVGIATNNPAAAAPGNSNPTTTNVA